MRGDLRKVIELDIDARRHAEALTRAFGEIKECRTEHDKLESRVRAIEEQQPILKLVRWAVFSMIGIAFTMLLTVLFQGVLRQSASFVVDSPMRQAK